MASFNPFDDLLTGTGGSDNNARQNNNPFERQPAPRQRPQQLFAVSPPQGGGGGGGGGDTFFDDAGGFFDSPPQQHASSSPVKAHNMSFTGLAEAGGGDGGGGGGSGGGFDDWSMFETSPVASPAQTRLGRKQSNLSPRVFEAAQRAARRRSGSNLPPSPARKEQSSVQKAFDFDDASDSSSSDSDSSDSDSSDSDGAAAPSSAAAAAAAAPNGTPHRTRQIRVDTQEDQAKTNELLSILHKVSNFSRHKSAAARDSLALAYAELDRFVKNPQYRDAGQAIDGLLEVYRALKQLEHDYGSMDKRLVSAYETLKKLAMQLGGQQADIFSRAQQICVEIRGTPVPEAPRAGEGPATPKRGNVTELERSYGLSAPRVLESLRPLLEQCRATAANKDTKLQQGGQLSGPLLMRKSSKMMFRKWSPAHFVLTNRRLVIFRGAGDAQRRAKPVVDVRMHGKMRLADFKPYPQKGGGVILSCKVQELDQTLGENGPAGAKWQTLFKFGSVRSARFELWKAAVNAAIRFNRKKDPRLAIKRTFSFGLPGLPNQ